jgi:hypothetical protein
MIQRFHESSPKGFDRATCVPNVSFGLQGDTLTPDEVSEIVGINPTWSWKKGDPFQATSGMHVRATGIWCLSSDAASTSVLVDHIEFVLRIIEPVSDTLKRLVAAQGWVRDIRMLRKRLKGIDTLELPSRLVGRICEICDYIVVTSIRENQTLKQNRFAE